jgi:hypothetical protein
MIESTSLPVLFGSLLGFLQPCRICTVITTSRPEGSNIHGRGANVDVLLLPRSDVRLPSASGDDPSKRGAQPVEGDSTRPAHQASGVQMRSTTVVTCRALERGDVMVVMAQVCPPEPRIIPHSSSLIRSLLGSVSLCLHPRR